MQDLTHTTSILQENSPAKRPSSQKIDLLYLEFENLKSRIHKSTQRKKEEPKASNPIQSGQLPQRYNSFLSKQQYYLSNYLPQTETQLHKTDNNQLFKNFETSHLKSDNPFFPLVSPFEVSSQQILSTYLKFQKDILQKIQKYERKLTLYEQTIKKIGRIVSTKRNNPSKNSAVKSTPNILSKQNENESICSIIMQYERRISTLTEDYQRKLEIAQENDKDKATYSSTVKDKESNCHEKEILMKETEINKMRLTNHKLKREYDQIKDKYETCTSRIAQLQALAIPPRKKDQGIQVKDRRDKNQIVQLQETILKMRKDLQSKDAQIDNLNAVLKSYSESSIKQHRDIQNPPEKAIFPFEQADRFPNDQFYSQLEQIEADSNILNEFYTKSQIIQPKRKKQILKNLKSLELQVNLMSEQNKHLKSKKDIFEQMANNNELDEQRFQQLTSILKTQIKRLNSEVKLLDEVTCLYVKNNQVDAAKIDELPNSLKCKPLLSQVNKSRSKQKK